MPAPQFQKLKAKIEQAMGTRPPDPEDDNDESEESDTRELRAVDAPAPRSSAAPQRAAASPRAATARRAAARVVPGVARAYLAGWRGGRAKGGSMATMGPEDRERFARREESTVGSISSREVEVERPWG